MFKSGRGGEEGVVGLYIVEPVPWPCGHLCIQPPTKSLPKLDLPIHAILDCSLLSAILQLAIVQEPCINLF